MWRFRHRHVAAADRPHGSVSTVAAGRLLPVAAVLAGAGLLVVDITLAAPFSAERVAAPDFYVYYLAVPLPKFVT